MTELRNLLGQVEDNVSVLTKTAAQCTSRAVQLLQKLVSQIEEAEQSPSANSNGSNGASANQPAPRHHQTEPIDSDEQAIAYYILAVAPGNQPFNIGKMLGDGSKHAGPVQGFLNCLLHTRHLGLDLGYTGPDFILRSRGDLNVEQHRNPDYRASDWPVVRASIDSYFMRAGQRS